MDDSDTLTPIDAVLTFDRGGAGIVDIPTKVYRAAEVDREIEKLKSILQLFVTAWDAPGNPEEGFWQQKKAIAKARKVLR